MPRSRFFALFMLLSLLITACTPAEDNSRTLTYGLTLNVSGIDPHIHRSTELGIVLRQVYDTLVYRHPETREFVPGLASDWQISDDGRVYTFNLRQGVTFHDGTPFNAEAVAANFARILDPTTASQRSRFLLGPLSGYQVLDDDTFQVTLAEPFAPLLDSLSQVYLGIASPTALQEYSENPLRYQYHQVGTGPFEFVEYMPEDRIVIQRNPDYTWKPDFYGTPGANEVERIEYRFFRDPATRLAALENGDAHIMGEILPTDARAITNDPSITLNPVPVPGQPLQFYFNTAQAPTDDLLVRQALIYAVNRTSVVEAVYQGFSPVAWGPISENALFYNRGVQNVYAYNLEQAQQLLEQAGYSDSDDDGILDRDGTPLEITVIQPPWGMVPQVAAFLEDQWRSLGIRVNLEPVPGYVGLIEAVNEGDYNLVSFDQPGLDPYILNQAYLSESDDNWTNYNNADLDTLLQEAARIRDQDARYNRYAQAQARIMEQALILPIRDYVNLNAHRAEVQGLQFDPYGWFPLLHDVTLAD